MKTTVSVEQLLPGLRELWDVTRGDPRVCVALLDGPVERSHQSLAAAEIAELQTLVPSAVDRGPAMEHGTHIASIIFGQAGGPVPGIAPRCRGLSLPIFTGTPDGSVAPCSQLDLARAIVQALEAGAQIINISGGELAPSGTAHPLLADAVRACAARNVLLVAAAGNDGCACLHIPGALPSVLAVGAMDSAGRASDFSNWGGQAGGQGLLAPGEQILGAVPGGGTIAQSGTSYAAAVVTGVAALLLSLQHTLGPTADPLAVRAALLASAAPCDEQLAGDCRPYMAGRLSIQGALGQIISAASAGAACPAPVRQKGSSSMDGTHAHVAASGCACKSSPEQAPGCACTSSREQASGTMAERAQLVSTASRPQLVFALGALGYDFETEARRDSIAQHMGGAGDTPANPDDPRQLLAYLETNPEQATSLWWTLSLDATPIYVVTPRGPFANRAYERLRQFLGEQLDEGVERVSIAGVIVGQARLASGQVVPAITPELRCMYSWTTQALVEAGLGDNGSGEEYSQQRQSVTNFLERIYHELRNLGLTAQERAINYAATNAFNANAIFRDAWRAKLELDTIEVERSPICRPESDCWDVKLLFFDPENVLRSRRSYRFTVDVSDICPVTVGAVRSWSLR